MASDDSKWFVHFQGKREGPISFAEMVAAFRASNQSPEFYVWTEGAADWAPASTLPDVQRALAAVSIKPIAGRPASGIVRPAGGIVTQPDPPETPRASPASASESANSERSQPKPKPQPKAAQGMPMYNFDAVKPVKVVPPPYPIFGLILFAAIFSFFHGHLPKLKVPEREMADFVAECTINSRKVDLTGKSLKTISIAHGSGRYRVETKGLAGTELFIFDGEMRSVYTKKGTSPFKLKEAPHRDSGQGPEKYWVRLTRDKGKQAEPIAKRPTLVAELAELKSEKTSKVEEWFDSETGMVLQRETEVTVKGKTTRSDIFKCKSVAFGPVPETKLLAPGETPKVSEDAGPSLFGNQMVFEGLSAVLALFLVGAVARMQEKPAKLWLVATLGLAYIGFVYVPYPYVRIAAGAFVAVLLMYAFERRRAGLM